MTYRERFCFLYSQKRQEPVSDRLPGTTDYASPPNYGTDAGGCTKNCMSREDLWTAFDDGSGAGVACGDAGSTGTRCGGTGCTGTSCAGTGCAAGSIAPGATVDGALFNGAEVSF